MGAIVCFATNATVPFRFRIDSEPEIGAGRSGWRSDAGRKSIKHPEDFAATRDL